MDLNYIVNTFLVTLKGIPVTLIIMAVAILLSFIPVSYTHLTLPTKRIV